MTNPSRILGAALLLCASFVPVRSQDSDLEVKRTFQQNYTAIREGLDSARTLAQVDSLNAEIARLQSQFAAKSTLLDRALYPETFTSSLHTLRQYHGITYERVYLIQTQGMAIQEYEARLAALEGRIDSLTSQNRQLIGDLRTARQSVSQLRERVRRLSNAMLQRDRLVFALVDTIFLPYDKDMQQVSDVQKEAIARKLLKANIVARVYDIAADNVKFMEATQLQGKDFKGAFDQLEQFRTKWTGLRDKLNSVALTADAALLDQPPAERTSRSTTPATPRRTTGGTGTRQADTAVATAPELEQPALFVDSALSQWEARLYGSFWSGLAGEFSSRGVPLRPFTDAAGFTAAVTAWVDSARADGRDVSAFVNDVWKERIDRDWREVLEREDVMGKVAYASLDQTVSGIGGKRFDTKFLLYVGLAAVAVGILLWIFKRKKPAAA